MNLQPITVSVVIPTYNRGRLLCDALDSIEKQTLPVFEIIVVDDGSTDETSQLIRRYAKVKYIRQNNAGPAAARNRGIREACGEYVAFMDSDDLWVPDKNEKQVAFMVRNPKVDISFGLMANVKEKSDDLIPVTGDDLIYQELRENAENITRMLEILIYDNVVPTPTVMIRRKCFDKAGYFPEAMRQAEDYALWLQAARYCRWGFIDSILLLRRLHDTNLTHDGLSRKTAVIGLFDSILAIGGLKPESQLLLRQRISSLHYDVGSLHLRSRSFGCALYHLTRVEMPPKPKLLLPKLVIVKLLHLFSRSGDDCVKKRSMGGNAECKKPAQPELLQ